MPVVVWIPTLTTHRLRLVPPRIADFEGYAAIVTSERGRFVDGPMTREEAWLDFSQMVAGWVLRGFGALTLRRRDGEEYLGTVLVHHEDGDPEPELGWLLTASAEGHGIAFEAAVVMRDWAFEHAGLERLASYIDPANSRAIALAERLGGVLQTGPVGAVTYIYTSQKDPARPLRS